ncbi:MAG: hypothetical protein OHK0017_03360 [Patescibacteria group bacterium]
MADNPEIKPIVDEMNQRAQELYDLRVRNLQQKGLPTDKGLWSQGQTIQVNELFRNAYQQAFEEIFVKYQLNRNAQLSESIRQSLGRILESSPTLDLGLKPTAPKSVQPDKNHSINQLPKRSTPSSSNSSSTTENKSNSTDTTQPNTSTSEDSGTNPNQEESVSDQIRRELGPSPDERMEEELLREHGYGPNGEESSATPNTDLADANPEEFTRRFGTNRDRRAVQGDSSGKSFKPSRDAVIDQSTANKVDELTGPLQAGSRFKGLNERVLDGFYGKGTKADPSLGIPAKPGPGEIKSGGLVLPGGGQIGGFPGTSNREVAAALASKIKSGTRSVGTGVQNLGKQIKGDDNSGGLKQKTGEAVEKLGSTIRNQVARALAQASISLLPWIAGALAFIIIFTVVIVVLIMIFCKALENPAGAFAARIAGIPTEVRQICKDIPGINVCNLSSSGALSGVCLTQQLEGKTDDDTVQLWKGNGGEVSTINYPVGAIREIIRAGQEAGVSSETIAFVLSVATTESVGNLWTADNGLGCYGIAQICAGSFGGGSYENWTQAALGRTPSPAEFMANPAMQMKTIEYGLQQKRAIGAFPDKPWIYGAAARWLGRGCDTYGTCDYDYGEAALRNFNIITCASGSGTPTSDIPTERTDFAILKIEKVLGMNRAYALGTKPSTYTDLTDGHKKFLAEIARERGYNAYVDRGGTSTEMKTALDAMMAAAKQANAELFIIGDQANPGYRSYDDQVDTYFNRGPDTGEGAKISNFYDDSLTEQQKAQVKQEYLNRAISSAPPGYSEHSTGLAIDLGDKATGDSTQLVRAFENTAGGKWLAANASTYGFTMSYPPSSTTGAGYEPWHFRFDGNVQYPNSTPINTLEGTGTGSGSVQTLDTCGGVTNSQLFCTNGEQVVASQINMQEQRERLAGLFRAGYIFSQDRDDIPNIVNGGFKDNLILLMLKVYDSGFTFATGANNGPRRGYGGHGAGLAMDFMAFKERNGQQIGMTYSTDESDEAGGQEIAKVWRVEENANTRRVVTAAVEVMKSTGVLHNNQLIGPNLLQDQGIVILGDRDVPGHDNHIHFHVDPDKPFNGGVCTSTPQNDQTNTTDSTNNQSQNNNQSTTQPTSFKVNSSYVLA